MSSNQPGILEAVPQHARYLNFSLTGEADVLSALKEISAIVDGDRIILGLGLSCLKTLNCSIAGMRSFPVESENGIDIPSTPAALWCWLRGTDPGELMHLSRSIENILAPTFILDSVTDAYEHDGGKDLTGYEDGTENPEGEEAINAALVAAGKPGLSGSSFVAVQQWLHDLDQFQSMPQEKQDHTIGRRLADNEELDEAPTSAHVKRTAQEDFDPEAFVLRRSMPWHDDSSAGLIFVAFGKSFDAFEALLNRMLGKDDGVQDALFSFTRPVSGAYFWCPPMKEGQLDLSLLEKAQ